MIGILIIIAFTLGYELIQKSGFRDLGNADLQTGRRVLTEQETTDFMIYYQRPAWRRFGTYFKLWWKKRKKKKRSFEVAIRARHVNHEMLWTQYWPARSGLRNCLVIHAKLLHFPALLLVNLVVTNGLWCQSKICFQCVHSRYRIFKVLRPHTPLLWEWICYFHIYQKILSSVKANSLTDVNCYQGLVISSNVLPLHVAQKFLMLRA